MEWVLFQANKDCLCKSISSFYHGPLWQPLGQYHSCCNFYPIHITNYHLPISSSVHLKYLHFSQWENFLTYSGETVLFTVCCSMIQSWVMGSLALPWPVSLTLFSGWCANRGADSTWTVGSGTYRRWDKVGLSHPQPAGTSEDTITRPRFGDGLASYPSCELFSPKIMA